MSILRFLLLGLMMSIFTVSCTHMHVYQPEIQQGNVITAEQKNNLRMGMNEKQITQILGNPVLKNVFDPGEMFYIYTLKPSFGKVAAEHLVLIFDRHRLTKIEQF